MDELRKTILDFVRREYVDDDDTEIDVHSPLISSGIVDSFSMVSLKSFLERKYKISIPDARAGPDDFDTVDQIASLVAQIQKGSSSW